MPRWSIFFIEKPTTGTRLNRCSFWQKLCENSIVHRKPFMCSPGHYRFWMKRAGGNWKSSLRHTADTDFNGCGFATRPMALEGPGQT